MVEILLPAGKKLFELILVDDWNPKFLSFA
jgi:hypothetical protein